MAHNPIQIHSVEENEFDPDFEYRGGSGIWTNWKNKKTGEESVQIHNPKVVKQWCKSDEHDFKLVDPANRVIECTKCGYEQTFILGMQQFKNGRLINMTITPDDSKFVYAPEAYSLDDLAEAYAVWTQKNQQQPSHVYMPTHIFKAFILDTKQITGEPTFLGIPVINLFS